MKPKHASLIAILLIMITVSLALWYEIERSKHTGERPGRATIKPLSELEVPGKSELDKMDRLMRKMHQLATPPPQIKRRVDLTCLGYIPLMNPLPSGGNGVFADAPEADYHVTLAFDGKIKRYCAIDGSLYAEGDQLPDGAVIEKIESRRVMVTRASMQQWLVVEPFFNTALSEKSLQGDNG